MEPDADWSELADSPPVSSSDKRYVRTPDQTPINAQATATAMPSPPRALEAPRSTESVIEIAKINPKSAGQLEASTIPSPSGVNPPAEQHTTHVPPQFEIVFSNGRSARRVEAIHSIPGEPARGLVQESTPEVSPSKIEFASATKASLEKSCLLKSPIPQPLAKEPAPAKQLDDQLAITPVAGEDVPSITFNRQLRSSRRLGVLDPKYTR
jgi:hypothetical protein